MTSEASDPPTEAPGGQGPAEDDPPISPRDDPVLGDALVAASGALGASLLLLADRGQRLGLGLTALALLAVMTAVATHTAVVGRHPSRARHVAGTALSVVATGLFLAWSAHRGALGIPAITVVAGLGRTGARSRLLRLVGLLSLGVAFVLV